MQALHNFHIPVMGLAFTIDSPIRVAQYGISSVISIMDDDLIEKMNAFYSRKFNIPYQEITQKIYDYRAKRITSYLNLVDKIVNEKFTAFKAELSENAAILENFRAMLPTTSEIKKGLENMIQESGSIKDNILKFCNDHLHPGDIDVNIMTKVDRENFEKNVPLPVEFNDAHAALRGFANSTLQSSVVLSAGLNPRLYGYFENFSDFFPDENSKLRKKITIKVSDFRSAMIQGNFFAKKGLWVSEFRIESGLNCGGHAFATDGLLLGPIMQEFKEKREELIDSMHQLLTKALLLKNAPVPQSPLPIKISVQGGVGTAEEHQFLIDHYNADSIGWGSPFLLVPEATSVDAATRELLAKAVEADLYTSNLSPLGVPFNTVKGTTTDFNRQKRIDNQKPGSPCPKKFLALNTEYGKEGICTASRKYQERKIKQLDSEAATISSAEYDAKHEAITEKACLCVGLANASLHENDIKIKGDDGVVVCPGPNIAYFGRQYSLKEMIQHIYGGPSIMESDNRPNLFIKELSLYLQFLNAAIKSGSLADKQLIKFRANLLDGIAYYRDLFTTGSFFKDKFVASIMALDLAEAELTSIPV
ncbi:MAG: hypothetical protein ITG00_08220 [Flavobacterium sp.]|nr:hypothetical protein [Flavobacterium sp.]